MDVGKTKLYVKQPEDTRINPVASISNSRLVNRSHKSTARKGYLFGSLYTRLHVQVNVTVQFPVKSMIYFLEQRQTT